MRAFLFLALLGVSAANAEVRTLTLRGAVDLALKQNPDLVLARLEEQKAEQDVRLARDAFVPKVVVGSGLAYSSGFPMSIEGASPSIFQASAIADVFNRAQSYRVAAAKESRRGASLSVADKRDEVAFRTADLYLQAARDARASEAAVRQLGELGRVVDAVKARIAEGRALPIEAKRAALNLARAQYRARALATSRTLNEAALASALGMQAEDSVRVVPEETETPPLPASEEAAVRLALDNNREVRALEARLLAQQLQVRAARAERLPKLALVAQYGMQAKFNNYEEFFRRFQRHNGQLGVSFQVPVWSGPGVSAAAERAEADLSALRTQIQAARRRIASEARRSYLALEQSEAAREVARLDLEIARDQVAILLAQSEEGRAGLEQIEEARLLETDKWIAFYDASADLERARLDLLNQVTSVAAALQ